MAGVRALVDMCTEMAYFAAFSKMESDMVAFGVGGCQVHVRVYVRTYGWSDYVCMCAEIEIPTFCSEYVMR